MVTQRNAMLYFTKCVAFLPFGSRVTLVLYLDANVALYCIQRQIGYYLDFSCRLVFPDVRQIKITFSTNFSGSLVYRNLINSANYNLDVCYCLCLLFVCFGEYSFFFVLSFFLRKSKMVLLEKYTFVPLHKCKMRFLEILLLCL